jgi:branched-chain amino acid transport system substrate-binding protein
MKQKVTAIILTALLVSVLMSAFSIQTVEAYRRTGIPPLRGDVNYDGIVDRNDIAIIVGAFRSYPGDPRWNPMADLNQDGKVNPRDLIIVVRNLGTRWIPGDDLVGEVSIGVLLPFTGDLASFGENGLAAAELAVEEVNEFLAANGAGWSLNLMVEDTEANPDICFDKVQILNGVGVKFIVGPLSSGEVRAIKDYCNDDANQILTISPSSTLPDLAEDDYIFRFHPNETRTGMATARIMYDDGKRYLIPVTLEDQWGVALEEAVAERFTYLEGAFPEPPEDRIRYPSGEDDFSDEASALNDAVMNAVTNGYPLDQVGVFFIGGNEVTDFFTAASSYALLSTVKWYGSEMTVRNQAMVDDPTVRDFAILVDYPCPIFAPTKSSKYETVRQHCLDTLGREPDQYVYMAYDAVWVIAYTLMTVDAYDGEASKAVIPTVLQNYFGASGWIVLDENGERRTGDYNIWQIMESAGAYNWEITGKYSLAADSIVWY